MRLLTDENIGLEVVQFLRSQGYDVISATEAFPGSEDIALLRKSYQQNRVLITSDNDFGELIYNQGIPHKGVILLRLSDEINTNKIKVLSGLLKSYKAKLPNNFATVTDTEVRIRKPKP